MSEASFEPSSDYKARASTSCFTFHIISFNPYLPSPRLSAQLSNLGRQSMSLNRMGTLKARPLPLYWSHLANSHGCNYLYLSLVILSPLSLTSIEYLLCTDPVPGTQDTENKRPHPCIPLRTSPHVGPEGQALTEVSHQPCGADPVITLTSSARKLRLSMAHPSVHKVTRQVNGETRTGSWAATALLTPETKAVSPAMLCCAARLRACERWGGSRSSQGFQGEADPGGDFGAGRTRSN